MYRISSAMAAASVKLPPTVENLPDLDGRKTVAKQARHRTGQRLSRPPTAERRFAERPNSRPLIRSLLAGFSVVSVLLLGSGCSLMNHTRSDITIEKIKSMPEHKKQKLTKPVTLVEAQIFAEQVRAGYHDSIDNQILLQNAVNLAFIPLAGLATFYGISSAHSDVVLGLSVAGAGTYILGQTFASQADQLIYASGMLATTCVLETFDPLISASVYRSELIALVGGRVVTTVPLNAGGSSKGTKEVVSIKLGTIQEKISTLEALLLGSDVPSPVSANANTLIFEARRILTEGRKARDVLDGAGQKLHNAIEGVRAQVTKALVENRPDPGALRDLAAQTFQASIPASLKPKLPASTPSQDPGKAAADATANLKAGEKEKRASKIKADVEAINTQMGALRDDLARLDLIIEAVAKTPDAAALAKCDIDANLAGITLKASVGKALTVVKIDDATDLNIAFVISGGRKPYTAHWEGQIDPGLGNPVITSGGQLTATIKGDTPTGEYGLIINDLNARPIRVAVHLAPPREPSK